MINKAKNLITEHQIKIWQIEENIFNKICLV